MYEYIMKLTSVTAFTKQKLKVRFKMKWSGE